MITFIWNPSLTYQEKDDVLHNQVMMKTSALCQQPVCDYMSFLRRNLPETQPLSIRQKASHHQIHTRCKEEVYSYLGFWWWRWREQRYCHNYLYVSLWKSPSLMLNSIAAKKTCTSLRNPTEKDNEGFLVDIDVQSVDVDTPTREDKRRDIDQFFLPPVSKIVNGKTKKYCCCKVCPYVPLLLVACSLLQPFCRGKKMIINEITTLRRHLEALHPVSHPHILQCIIEPLSWWTIIGKISQMGAREQFWVKAAGRHQEAEGSRRTSDANPGPWP